MKKFSLYTLISVIIINFFLPFGISLSNNLVERKIAEAANDCVISSAFWDPSGEQADKFYREGATTANIKVKSKNCVGVTGINLTIYESDGWGTFKDDVWDDSGLDDREISIPSDNFAVRLLLGEEDCETKLTGGFKFDCDLYFKFKSGTDVIYSSVNIGSNGDTAGSSDPGWLWYGCDYTTGELCDQDGQFLEVIALGNNDDSVNFDALDPINLDNSYNLLAPIGDFTKAPDNMGDYFQLIFELAIALCAVLAVVMIVIGGIQYMGNESIFGKTEAKSKIKYAIGGLLIALGAYALLNTINPDLLGGKGVTIDQVSAEIVRDRASDPAFMQNIDSFDTSNITITPSDYSDPTFLGYMGHQQGSAGASAILWSAHKGYTSVPADNPFTKSDINRNMKGNFNTTSAQKTIGTSVLTPDNFLKYWATKVAAVKNETTPVIPSMIESELGKVASETGVDIATLKTICRIESAGGCTNDSSITTVNNLGYAGLFQLSNKVYQKNTGVWEAYKKSDGVLLDAYHNAFVAAKYFSVNLSGIKKNWSKINN
ncbi:MAG: pilin [Candidatus Paceibacterota bacterium]|jgi:hypothetical protein